ncbi:Aste57867_24590 [Aphanomyces stellatus]|uniref:Aste57867_24590 protein n=1 Tax=Aphanomyces stellatus TaxID=120398 RepID=A0A485LQV7_9STRA|nr:hypothetical protein As57867_024512 [Aphanomyces stellatus]VFU01229.1 Aste57867_24590 [Aphanomyces stellatus]
MLVRSLFLAFCMAVVVIAQHPQRIIRPLDQPTNSTAPRPNTTNTVNTTNNETVTAPPPAMTEPTEVAALEAALTDPHPRIMRRPSPTSPVPTEAARAPSGDQDTQTSPSANETAPPELDVQDDIGEFPWVRLAQQLESAMLP